MEADFVGDCEHLDLRRRPGVVVADVVVDARRPPVLLPGVCPALEAHPHHLRDREHVLHGPHAEGRPENGRLGEVRDVRGEPRRAALMAGLLDGYACTECGRGTAAWPANATGKPLNPMRDHT